MPLIIIIFSTFICYQIYFQKVIAKKIPSKRKQKIFRILKVRFQGLKENNLGFFEYQIDNKNILFEYKTIRNKNNFSNILKIYLDISNIEDDIKKLCKIHFYCSNIDNRDWVGLHVKAFYGSLNNLAKNSDKTLHEIISDTETYISIKRAERDKK
ncbi:hypothetical protein B0A67_02750 [Flavobacterium aquidurense]|jgi:hypothetical protein|uniref:hypothetical protein n=1 Tax=Flavobacterium aquidurense TaxID=362413 RepID=UPI00091077A5|nr:hypothetical protein [Flavobacterium aquidurense]OXA73614.1 hypothetical protein B0A67_02750 [Flavobacterium aquidurense]SHG74547.1 hypothetical protein SAMN05444481_10740 [Flavobacterium frigidimaris]